VLLAVQSRDKITNVSRDALGSIPAVRRR
jgi:hypothetical protein